MLRIRREQIAAFLPKNDRETVDFIIGHLKDESPELVDRIPEDGLREMVSNGVDRARKYGLNSLADLAGFVSIMFEIAPNFDEIPEIQNVLSNRKIPPEAKFSMLFEKELDEAWEKAAESYDPEAWAEAWFPELRDERG